MLRAGKLLVALVTAGALTSCAQPPPSAVAPVPVAERVDDRTRRALVRAAERYLEGDPAQTADGLLATRHSYLQPRTFCRVEFIETRRVAAARLLAVYAFCEELARSGEALMVGSGFARLYLFSLHETPSGRFQVRDAQFPPDGPDYHAWITRAFTPPAVHRALRLDHGGTNSDLLHAQARRVFGLPAYAPAVYPR
ncbi:hypothetical protein [Bailinhaonella thermotolerans]|uniref:Lipoprotein n=1 Tax=Bailinhaonella thermotolerans TaxID=1070861 RepID=A0A3A4BGC6_9ACTN|nr:hypothetical protein [Bailinhaonella thermotolerans]RJL30362.1 hypothetical protein D5H75_22550 [Bailinhaonella thermotolerans]